MNLLDAAVRNNAAWCAAVCAANRIDGDWSGEAWSSSTRTPQLYPDAVTLRAGVDVAPLLRRIDDGPGCSVKDSYATLDLHPAGFRVLFTAEWLAFDTALGAPTLGWTRSTSRDDLNVWNIPAFVSELLDDVNVAAVVRRVDGMIHAGAFGFASDGVVGISNLVQPIGGSVAVGDVVSSLAAIWPVALPVGYESGPELEHALAAGARRLGPLRVWIKE